MKDYVFALDIGTQSVTGILLEKVETTYRIIDFCVRHHEERAMLDGQIQNVVQVAKIISEVKLELEKKHGLLNKVCVAAAGRALKTIQAEKTLEIKDKPITSEEEIRHLELSAVQQALANITEQNKSQFSHYHCVGYSVLHYKLDGEKIGSFIDQVGDKATVQIIATFLPRIVIESLLAALERAELTMEALTLEPIAAIHVLVPESMRRLNVALIDIGAGTSDIAISNHGTVIAYGMVPTAGDEITEAISDQYLLDFKVAEKTKQTIVNEKSATVHDILGMETTITYEDLVIQISDSIDELAHLLAQEVRLLNGKIPQAVMLIGGGSLTPKLNEKIAEHLQLPPNRVAVRGVEAIQNLEKNDKVPTGPDFVTPLGIAISATQNPLHYISVYVNEQITFMFETKQLTVGDCLIQAGIDINKYYGKIGLAAIIMLNGKEMILRGKYGESPKIFVNEKEATVDHPIRPDDKITISKGENGTSPSYTIEDLVGTIQEITLTCNSKKYVVKPTYLVNNQPKTKDYIVQDKDEIIVQMPKTIHDFVNLYLKETFKDSKPFYVKVNKRTVQLPSGSTKLLLNGEPTTPSAMIKSGDEIAIVPSEEVTVKTLLNQLKKPFKYSITVYFNGEAVELVQQQVEINRGKESLDEKAILHDGDQLILADKKVRSFIFQDVFRHIDIDMSNVKGNYQLFRNDKPTSFHDKIIHGDQLEIRWD